MTTLAKTVPVTAVVLTFNEERNIGACLESLQGWVADVVVVDSGSTDGTLAIVRERGVRVVSHAFTTHAAQWQWALGEVLVSTDWVLGLDADQRVTPDLRQAIVDALSTGASEDVDGYFMARRQIFRGRWIRHGGYYPKYLLKLFRRSTVRLDPAELVDHHFHVDGRTRQLSGDLIEDNRNEMAIAVWTEKHNRYAALQARQEIREEAEGVRVGIASLTQSPDARTRWMKQLWRRMPLFLRPTVYVFYRYVIRLGFLDGKQGFIFHVLQAFWYRLLVDVNIDERRSEPGAPSVSGGTP